MSCSNDGYPQFTDQHWAPYTPSKKELTYGDAPRTLRDYKKPTEVRILGQQVGMGEVFIPSPQYMESLREYAQKNKFDKPWEKDITIGIFSTPYKPETEVKINFNMMQIKQLKDLALAGGVTPMREIIERQAKKLADDYSTFMSIDFPRYQEDVSKSMDELANMKVDTERVQNAIQGFLDTHKNCKKLHERYRTTEQFRKDSEAIHFWVSKGKINLLLPEYLLMFYSPLLRCDLVNYIADYPNDTQGYHSFARRLRAYGDLNTELMHGRVSTRLRHVIQSMVGVLTNKPRLTLVVAAYIPLEAFEWLESLGFELKNFSNLTEQESNTLRMDERRFITHVNDVKKSMSNTIEKKGNQVQPMEETNKLDEFEFLSDSIKIKELDEFDIESITDELKKSKDLDVRQINDKPFLVGKGIKAEISKDSLTKLIRDKLKEYKSVRSLMSSKIFSILVSLRLIEEIKLTQKSKNPLDIF